MKTLVEKAILVSLNITQWTARKFDRKITDEVNKKHNATDAGRFNKLLIATDHLKEITQVVTEARTFHANNTLPWNNDGQRLLPAEQYFEYTARVSELKEKYETAVRKFILSYPTMIDEARERLNGMFSEEDYPKDIASRFALTTSFMPVPDAADLRINVSDEEVSKLKAEISSEINNRMAAAQGDIYQRMTDHLKRMHERLADKKAIFRDSLFDDLLGMVELLPKLNIAGDKNVITLCEELRSLYCDPQEVRENVRKRKAKADEVNDILKKINGFMA